MLAVAFALGSVRAAPVSRHVIVAYDDEWSVEFLGERARPWSGKHRPPLTGQGVYPRPLQDPLPIWLGVGGTPNSFVRAGALGRPLMVAIIGGEVKRFRPLIDLYRVAGMCAGHPSERLKVGMHAPGYVAATTKAAADDFFPGWASAIASVAKERGWPPVTRADFDAQRGPEGALLVGSQEVAEKVAHHSEALGGLSRVSFQMNPASLPHSKLMRAIEAVGEGVAPALCALARRRKATISPRPIAGG